jgi:hypothetical protein
VYPTSPSSAVRPALTAASRASDRPGGPRRPARSRQDHRRPARALLDQPWAADGRSSCWSPAASPPSPPRPACPHAVERVRRHRWLSAACIPSRPHPIEVVTERAWFTSARMLDDPGLEGRPPPSSSTSSTSAALDADLGPRPRARRPGRAPPRPAPAGDERHPRRRPRRPPARRRPVIESQGRAHPVETRHLGRDPRLRIEDQVVRAVERALGRGAWLHPRLPPRPGRDSPHRRASGRARPRPRRPPRSPLRRARLRRAGPGDQPRPAGRAQGRPRHLHRRDQPDHRGRAGGDRQRPRPRPTVRPGQRPDPA